MSIKFEPATRTDVPLLIGLAGGTGSGKTFTGMRVAKGLSGGKRFAVIDTENGRARHYADQFEFDVADLRAPFTPQAYLEAIKAADAAGYSVIMVDSASHEHAGDGGLLDMHEAELDRMAGQDWKKRESCNMAAWIKPKGAHKEMMNALLQVKAHVILCFRAEEKIEIKKEEDENGRMKTVIRPKQSTKGKNGWLPISEKNLPFELTCSFLFMDDKPGVPLPIKLQEQHKPFFPLDKPVTEAAGAALAQWSRGSKVGSSAPGTAHVEDGPYITADQAIYLDDLIKEHPSVTANIKGVGEVSLKDAVLRRAQCETLAQMPAAKYEAAKKWLIEKIENWKQHGTEIGANNPEATA
jgi:hypothetical protein